MFVTRNSLKEIQLSIKKLKEQLEEIQKNKALAIEQGVGDGWHDNFAFEQATMQERMILKRIQDLEKTMAEAVILDENSLSFNIITIGSNVKIRVYDKDRNSKELEFRIVDIKRDSGLKEATLNSPIGQALLNKEVGEFGEYVLGNGQEFEFEVLSIDNN